MTRTRISFIASTALASILGGAMPALAQAPVAPPPAVAPAPEAAVMPAAPMMAPRGADDMTGSVGFGTGVVAGTSFVAPSDSLILKYWLSDVLAVVPSLTLGITKVSGGAPTGWNFSPQALITYVPWKSTSTRLSVGAGLGLSFHKNTSAADAANTHVGVAIPIQAGVEHFFTRWFSMGIALNTQFLNYSKDGSAYTLSFFNIDSPNTTNFLASLMFYTD
jgi:hypothetical protein